MFLFLPVKVEEPRQWATVPVVNYALIALNVLVFCMAEWGWLGFWYVGPDTGFLSVLLYAFGHAHAFHLAGNMYFLLLFGNAVNRRLGHGYYLLGYLFCAVSAGLIAKLLGASVIGSSGAIFGVMMMCFILTPSARLVIGFFALFPITVLVGMLLPTKEWVFWFIRWDSFRLRAWWCLFLIPLLEIWSLGWTRHHFGVWNWTNLGHLLGVLFGIAFVLLLPRKVSMRQPVAAELI